MKKRIAVMLEQEEIDWLRAEVARQQIAQGKTRNEINMSTIIEQAVEKLREGKR